MIAIVPAKAGSTRLIEKNFIPFHNGKSLCDIQVEKLLQVLPPEKIYLSSEDQSKQEIADRYHIRFMLRDERLADNDTRLDEVIKGVYRQTGSDDDMAWCQVINPLFSDYKNCFSLWENQVDKEKHDSLA